MFIVVACGGPANSANQSPSPSVQAANDIHKIEHVVVIMQENRSLDQYFGTYPGADGFPRQGGQFTVCVPDPANGGCVRPYNDPNDRTGGGPHGSSSATADINGGKMDGFVAQAEGGKKGCAESADPNCARDSQLLGLRSELRPPGPHVPAQRVMEFPAAPVPRLRMGREVQQDRRPDELRDEYRFAGEQHRGERRQDQRRQPGGAQLCLDLAHVPALHAQGELALLRR